MSKFLTNNKSNQNSPNLYIKKSAERYGFVKGIIKKVNDDIVKHISGRSFSIRLFNKKKINVFINGKFIYPTTSIDGVASLKCHFLGTISMRSWNNWNMHEPVSMLQIKTGWFLFFYTSSFLVSHDALVCLDELGIPISSLNDWQGAVKRKDDVLNYYCQQEVNIKEQEKLEKLENKRRRAQEKKDRESRKQARLKKRKEDLIKRFGNESAKKILQKKIWQGMTKDMLIESWGKPGDIDETVYKSKTKAKCFFNPYKTRQKTTKYKNRVDLENNLVVGWKDLE